jgi:hypothetical protein
MLSRPLSFQYWQGLRCRPEVQLCLLRILAPKLQSTTQAGHPRGPQEILEAKSVFFRPVSGIVICLAFVPNL